VVDSLAWALSLARLERMINHALCYAIEWPDYATTLNGSVLRAQLLPVQKNVYVFFQNNQLSLKTIGPDNPDLSISAPPSALLEMLQKKRAGANIHISGNAHLAQTLQQAINALKIDWEGILADKMGDIPAHQASTIFGKVKNFTTRFVSTMIADTADYLVDEKQLLPSSSEVKVFYDEVTQLRYAADRLEARLRMLEATYAE